MLKMVLRQPPPPLLLLLPAMTRYNSLLTRRHMCQRAKFTVSSPPPPRTVFCHISTFPALPVARLAYHDVSPTIPVGAAHSHPCWPVRT